MIAQSQLQKQNMKILPQQVQLLGIHHLNCMDLLQRIKDELDENPLLESTSEDESELSIQDDGPQEYQNLEEYMYDDIPGYGGAETQAYIHNTTVDIPIKEILDFREGLKQQLINLDLEEDEHKIASFILDCVGDNGLLERPVIDVADDYSFVHKTFVEEYAIEKVLHKVQNLEPIGIACQNIQDFLLKQLEIQKHDTIVKKSAQLIKDHYTDLQKRNFEKICAALNIDEEELAILLKHIAKLKLYPLNIAEENKIAKDTIIPDYVLIEDGENLMVDLYKQQSNSLQINESLLRSVNETDIKRSDEKGTAQYLKSKLASAQWFIDAIRQREENMLHIMKAILKKQKQYFLTGDKSDLAPMVLKNIAEEIGLDISTVSRVTCNKYVDTPFGLILLKDLFTEGLTNEEGISTSNKVVQIKLKEIIDSEDAENPYNDQQLVHLLKERGIRIARRTIAKYRELMHIPVGAMRRLWSKAK